METSLGSARRALRQLGDRGRTTRIPDEVRLVVLAHASEARSAGASWALVASRLGLSQTALQRWSRASAVRGRFLPVVVPEAPASVPTSGLTLTTPHGEKLEGLDVDEAIRIMRGLR